MRELFMVNVRLDPEEKYAICCNPGARFHGWLFKLNANNEWISINRLQPIDPVTASEKLFGEDETHDRGST
jgi:hypothetical protein